MIPATPETTEIKTALFDHGVPQEVLNFGSIFFRYTGRMLFQMKRVLSLHRGISLNLLSNVIFSVMFLVLMLSSWFVMYTSPMLLSFQPYFVIQCCS